MRCRPLRCPLTTVLQRLTLSRHQSRCTDLIAAARPLEALGTTTVKTGDASRHFIEYTRSVCAQTSQAKVA